MKRIANPSLYLKSLSQEERDDLQKKVEARASAFLFSKSPGEAVVVDDMCAELGFNEAHRQLLNGYLKALSTARFGHLVLGRKGRKTSFRTWDAQQIMNEFWDNTQSYETVLDALREARDRLAMMLLRLDQLVSQSEDGVPVPDHESAPGRVVGDEP